MVVWFAVFDVDYTVGQIKGLLSECQVVNGVAMLFGGEEWFGEIKKPQNLILRLLEFVVPRDGIEPPTRGFSILCSTD